MDQKRQLGHSFQQEVDELLAMDEKIQEVKKTLIAEISKVDEEVKDAENLRKDMITITWDFEEFKFVSLKEMSTPPLPNDNTQLIF